ncbi:MAG TPA: hypothetical protein VIS56_01810 [Candidatus Saccharimonadales bacterium]
MNSNQSGYVSSMLISLIVAIMLLFGAIGFGAWAFAGRQDYKNNSDKKAAKAAEASKEATQAADAAKYAEESKSPLKTHKAPDQFGGVTVQYPRTWSGYVNEDGSGSTPVDDYFHPSVVPATGRKKGTAYALRIQVVEQTYDRVVDSFSDDVENKKVSASPVTLPKVSSAIGTRFDGEIEDEKQGVMVVLPMRNLTLKIWTESKDYQSDFENHILPNIVFSP